MAEERLLTYAQAINEGTRELMREDESVLVMGLGVPTPTGVFGTTTGLLEEFGPRRVLDTPAAENGMTGIAVGMAISGLRPILVHHRVDFAVLSMEPIVNQAAKWHFMYGGKATAPLTIRMIIGRGWGQGPQHSQSLQAWFAHIPGLQVLMPATPDDAHGLLQQAVRGDRPTVILEHRWLFALEGRVASTPVPARIGAATVRRYGSDVSIVATSIMVIEALQAAEVLASKGISAEVIDLRSITPLDSNLVLESVRKTGNLVIADTATVKFGIAAEIAAVVAEEIAPTKRIRITRLGVPHAPTPTSHGLTSTFYSSADDIVQDVLRWLRPGSSSEHDYSRGTLHDVPNPDFIGPY